MKTASRFLGTAFFHMGFEVQDAPRYGAERRGAPIFAYVRASKHPIFERGIIQIPDLIIVADDSLIPVPGAGVLNGIDDHTLILINSNKNQDIWSERLNISDNILVVDLAQNNAYTDAFPTIGSSCVGAAACLTGKITKEALIAAITEELAEHTATVIERNIHYACLAFDLMNLQTRRIVRGVKSSALTYSPPEWIDIPLDSVCLGAPNIYAAQTSNQLNTGSWRIFRPVIDYQRCKKCWWVCSNFCPDSAISVKDKTPLIDYDHCKGCLICAAQCPPHAIETIRETEYIASS
jgi:pyruvate ferredoxin oxidoreductase gamma subunit